LHMSNSKNEPVIKDQLLQRLKSKDSHWIDGDAEQGKENQKTVDLVNHESKIAIEIKDVTYSLLSNHRENLKKLNNVLMDALQDSCLKFSKYPRYKTCLFILSNDDDLSIVEYALLGCVAFTKPNGSLVEIPRTKKYKDNIWNNTGCFVLFYSQSNYKFVVNPYLKNDIRKMDQEVVEKMLRSI